MDNRFLPFIENTVNDDYVYEAIADEYLWMLEKICKGIYHLPSNFDDVDENVDIRELSAKPDLELLLVHIYFKQVNG